MNLAKELLDKDYPVKDVNNGVVSYKKITKVLELENIAGFVVGLEGNEPSLYIPYKDAYKITQESISKFLQPMEDKFNELRGRQLSETEIEKIKEFLNYVQKNILFPIEALNKREQTK